VNLPEARVRVSPDLRITLEPESLRIDGNIVIPYARIQPLTIASARYPSADTVIIGEAATESTAPREFAFDVAVTVGDDVRFDGFGLAARLGGNLRIRNRQGVTIGNGELNVRKGSYTIGTAKLDIQSGALLFAGGPVNNPGLSVRGVRQMQTVTVGVNVGGTLRQPEISLFSDPPMRQSDIISYLAFAKPASTLTPEEGESVDRTGGALAVAGAGIAAADISSRIGLDEISIRSEGQEDDSQLVLGKYVTPRIYVSYGFGLFEPINTLRLRLNITNRLLLLTESGLEDSADILYTWDR
jgi:translocation and assembly module TamB